jgi:hypothetical protein
LWRQQFIPEDVSGCPEKIGLKQLGDNIGTNGITSQQLFTFEDGSRFIEIGWNSGIKVLN